MDTSSIWHRLGGTGTFDIFDWVAVLTLVLITTVPIYMASKEKTLTRGPYFFRVLSLFIFGNVLKGAVLEILSALDDRVDFFAIVNGISILIFWSLTVLWSVHRVQDIGCSKWWNLLILPLNLIYLLLILFWPGREVEKQQLGWLLGGSAVFVGLVVFLFWLAFVMVEPWDKYTAAGNSAYQQGDYTEAEKQYAAAIIEVEGFGPEEPRLATSFNNLANLYRAQGRYGEAEPLFERALAIVENVFGSDHPRAAKRPSRSRSAPWRSGRRR